MTLNIPPDGQLLVAGSQNQNNPPDLKLNQVLAAKVVDIQPASGTISLSVADRSLQVQLEQPVSLQIGQTLQLQVVKLTPAVELQILPQKTAMPAGEAITGLPGILAQPAILDTANSTTTPMDINLTLDTRLAGNLTNSNLLQGLQLNQIVDATVLKTPIFQNAVALQIGNKTLLVQTPQDLKLQPGETLQLQLVKLQPAPTFKILTETLPANASAATPQTATGQTLRLLSQAPPTPPAAPAANLPASPLQIGQRLTAVVVNVENGKLSLQLLPTPGSTANQPPPQNPAKPATAPATTQPTAPPAATNTATTGGNPNNSPGNPTPTQLTQAPSQILVLDAKQLLLTPPGNNPLLPAAKNPTANVSQLTPGTQIELQVVKTGEAPVFAVTVNTVPAHISEQKLTELLKQLLPIQASPSVFLNHLTQAMPGLTANASVPEVLKQLAQQILAAIPQTAQLSQPEPLKQSIAQSGLFMESKLAELLAGKPEMNIQADLKVKLVKFVMALNREIDVQNQQSHSDSVELLKTLLQKTDSALAKLTLDQFNSLPNDETGKQAWVLELPFFQQNSAETLRIEIQQDKNAEHENSEGQAEKNWAVSITITPPDLATIYCRISCYDGAVNTRFWSDKADTVAKINTHLAYLQKQFELQGLKTGFMEAHQGKPSQSESLKKPLANLLSEKV